MRRSITTVVLFVGKSQARRAAEGARAAHVLSCLCEKGSGSIDSDDCDGFHRGEGQAEVVGLKCTAANVYLMHPEC